MCIYKSSDLFLLLVCVCVWCVCMCVRACVRVCVCVWGGCTSPVICSCYWRMSDTPETYANNPLLFITATEAAQAPRTYVET